MSTVILCLLSSEKKLLNSVGVCCPDSTLYLKVGFLQNGQGRDARMAILTERTIFVETSTLLRYNDGKPFRLPSPHGFLGIGQKPGQIQVLSTESGFFQFRKIGNDDGLDDIFMEAWSSHMGSMGR